MVICLGNYFGGNRWSVKGDSVSLPSQLTNALDKKVMLLEMLPFALSSLVCVSEAGCVCMSVLPVPTLCLRVRVVCLAEV